MIELLVVIAIIAILAAILFPVFARAREKARQVACQSNLKQFALAVQMYKQDYDEMFPPFAYLTPTGFVTAFQSVLPYVKNDQIILCPNDKVGRVIGTNPVIPSPPAPKASYAVNLADPILALVDPVPPSYVLGDPSGIFTGGIPRPVVSDSEIQNPAQTTALWDGRAGSTFPPIPPVLVPDACHNEMMNVAFCDGHVKAIKSSRSLGIAPYTTNDFCLGVP